MKQYRLLVLALLLVVILSGCNEKIVPTSGIQQYIYSQISNSPNREIRLLAKDVFMVDEGHYLIKVVKDEDKDKAIIPTYDLDVYDIPRPRNNLGITIHEPFVRYTKEKYKYVVIKDNGQRAIDSNDLSLTDTYPVFDVEIYVPDSGLGSMPDDKGKLGIDENIKIN